MRFYVGSGLETAIKNQLTPVWKSPKRSLIDPPIVDQWPPVVPRRHAGVVELVDAPDSKSGSERSVGSIPTARTILQIDLSTLSVGSSV